MLRACCKFYASPCAAACLPLLLPLCLRSVQGWVRRYFVVDSGACHAGPDHISVLQSLTTSASRVARSTVVEQGTVEPMVALPDKREALLLQLQSVAGTSIAGSELTVLQGPATILGGGTPPA